MRVCVCAAGGRGLATETDEDSVTRGSESVIKLPKHLAERRGVEGGTRRGKGGRRGHGVKKENLCGRRHRHQPFHPSDNDNKTPTLTLCVRRLEKRAAVQKAISTMRNN